MQLGDILVRKKLATREQVNEALERQKVSGAPIGLILVDMEVLTQDELDSIINAPPKAPHSLADTGVPLGDLRNLLVKTMNFHEFIVPSKIAEELRLPSPIVRELVEDCINQKLLEVLGSAGDGSISSELRYGLTTAGKRRAAEALDQNLYVGPAPVSLEAYHEQISIQKITNERVSPRQVQKAFEDLVIPQEFVESIGPAINSGRTMLLYGHPGNGKTSIAERIAGIFTNVIYIPYCIYVDGQIMKVFDPSVHTEVNVEERKESVSIRRDSTDRRWVPCLRPVVITGGELTLEMLDLNYSPHARFYEAPLHVKALGGTFIIDDFGRQLVRPEDLLNRWIVPLQSRVDYLKLHSGKSFVVPFDELIIFSTNMEPNDLMDPAFLRRIPFKLKTEVPNEEEYYEIFESVADEEGLQLDPQIVRKVIDKLTVENDHELACYQPRFLVDQVLATCKFQGIPPELRPDLVERALGHLYVEPARKGGSRKDARGRQAAVEEAVTGGFGTPAMSAAPASMGNA